MVIAWLMVGLFVLKCSGEIASVDTEIAIATTFVEVKGGTRVRMVGAQKVKTGGVSSKALTVKDGPEGRGVLVNVDPNALCHLIIEAKIKPKIAICENPIFIMHPRSNSLNTESNYYSISATGTAHNSAAHITISSDCTSTDFNIDRCDSASISRADRELIYAHAFITSSSTPQQL